MNLSKVSNKFLLDRLKIPKGKVNMVLDTDTYNEIDDQFAVMYALRSPDRLNVQAIYAAPFSNERAKTPGEGMEKSYEEILRVLDRMKINTDGLVYKGSNSYLKDIATPCESPAALDLIKKAMASEEPLYVVAIGAITNIASAILLEPRIIEKIVVIWLGGHALHWTRNDEFNLMQDVPAAQIIFNSGVPLVQVPCLNVTSHLTTTIHELKYYMDGKSDISTYLYNIFCDYVAEKKTLTKEIWDISAVAYLINPDWVTTHIVHSPILNENLTWSRDTGRHFIKTAITLDRDAIFRDLYSKL